MRIGQKQRWTLPAIAPYHSVYCCKRPPLRRPLFVCHTGVASDDEEDAMRRTTLAISVLWKSIAAVALPVGASPRPSKDVRIIAPFPAGSPADQIVRLIVDPSSRSGTRPWWLKMWPAQRGRSGWQSGEVRARRLHARHVRRRRRRGQHKPCINPCRMIRSRSLHRSFRSAGRPNILVVNNDVPARTLAEFVASAKENPGMSRSTAQVTALFSTWASSSSRRWRTFRSCTFRARTRPHPRSWAVTCMPRS